MMSFAKHLVRPLINGLLPHNCVICQSRANTRCCDGCWRDLPWIESGCSHCSLPLPTRHTFSTQDNNAQCGECLASPPIFDICISACRYDHPIDHLINRFKFHGDFTAGQLLADILTEHLSNRIASLDIAALDTAPLDTATPRWPDAIFAVPLHWRRHWQRGFNQSQFLAEQLGNTFNIEVHNDISRRHHTPKQQNLKRSQRLRNLRNAFATEMRFDGQHIALVDDVVTTASTANTLAKLLKKAGASRVDIWSVARTPASAK